MHVSDASGLVSRTERCHFCSDGATAGYWLTNQPDGLRCCRQCALNTLPALIADSLFLGTNPVGDAEQQLVNIKAAYWRAVACRLANGGRGR